MISGRVIRTNSPPLVKLGALAAKTKDCISLGQGVPYYQPPPALLKEFVSDINNPKYHRYAPDPGIIELRTILAKKLGQENGINAHENEITITPGANQAFVNTLFTITDPGDKVILLTPYYFNHEMACNLANLDVIQVPLNADYTISSEKLSEAIRNDIKAIIFVNPGNPTGAVHTQDDINILKETIIGTKTWLISDETYEYFTYGKAQHISPASVSDLSEQTVTISSFSKIFGIPGWRVGYYHGNKEFTEHSMKVQDTMGICAPAPSQYLAVKLLENKKSIIPKVKKLMENNHRIAKDLLEEVNWLEEENGTGAYYLFPKQTTGKSSSSLAHDLIVNQKVALVPGSSFGKDWEDYFRISFANVTPEILKEAFSRLKEFDVLG